MKYLFVLYLYYPQYAKKTIQVARAIHSRMPQGSELVYVTDQHLGIRLALSDFEFQTTCRNLNEFLAWDRGMSLRKGLSDFDLLVVANDTFAVHHPWGEKCNQSALRDFERLSSSKIPEMSGELVVKEGCDFSLFQRPADRWVSTYFFAMNRGALKRIDCFCFSEDERSALERHGYQDELLVSSGLRSHIDRWLNSKSGWYKSRLATADQKRRKAISILEEFNLSAKARERGVLVGDARYYEGMPASRVGKLIVLAKDRNLEYLKFRCRKWMAQHLSMSRL